MMIAILRFCSRTTRSPDVDERHREERQENDREYDGHSGNGTYYLLTHFANGSSRKLNETTHDRS